MRDFSKEKLIKKVEGRRPIIKKAQYPDASSAQRGLMSADDKVKMDTVEDSATADQTGAEIKTAYQAEANAYTDTKNTKLSGIDTGAKDDQTGAEIKTAYEAEANAFTDTKNTKLTGIDTGADVANDSEPTVISCHNATGSAIAIRSVCYISGDQSGVPQITKAQASAEANCKGMLVMVMAEIANGAAGDCRVLGKVSGFSGLTPGAIQYLSDDTAGLIEETATVTATEIVRIVGYALSATVVFFNPDKTYIEVAA